MNGVENLTELKRKILGPQPAAVDRWNLLGVKDLSTELPPIPWLCEGVGLAPGAVSLFAGYGYSRKTMALQSAAVSVASGRRLWGLFDVRQGKALHLDYEQGRRITQERYQRLARGMDFELNTLEEGALRVASMPHIYLDSNDAADELLRLCDGVSFALVDSLRAAFPHADENSSEVRSYLDILNRVSERTGCCIAVIHHARKPNKDSADGATFAIRGSSALFDACQSVYVFEGAKDTPTTVHHQKDRIRGTTVEEFGIIGVDVPNPAVEVKNHRWGLRVEHLEREQIAKHASDAEAALDRAGGAKVAESVHATLAKFAGVFRGSKTAFREACGVKVRHARFIAVLGELIQSGMVVQGGSYNSPEFTLGALA